MKEDNKDFPFFILGKNLGLNPPPQIFWGKFGRKPKKNGGVGGYIAPSWAGSYYPKRGFPGPVFFFYMGEKGPNRGWTPGFTGWKNDRRWIPDEKN